MHGQGKEIGPIDQMIYYFSTAAARDTHHAIKPADGCDNSLLFYYNLL